MKKEDAKTSLSPAFNIWGFVPPHMLLGGGACFGFQNAREQQQQRDELRRQDTMMAHTHMLNLRQFLPAF